MEQFKVVTKELLEQLTLKHYGAGRELKVGDLIIYGFTIAYSSLDTRQPNSFTIEDASHLNFNAFVLDDITGFLHQLYNQK